MAAPLEQNEIDALLSSDLLDDIGADDSMSAPPAPSAAPGKKSKTRHFGVPVSSPYRFHFKYKSPVLKSSEVLYDPDPENEVESPTPVVRSLSNYARFIKANTDRPVEI